MKYSRMQERSAHANTMTISASNRSFGRPGTTESKPSNPPPQPEQLETAINGDSTRLAFEEVNHDIVAIDDNAIVGRWISSAAVSADVAATDVLSARVPSWERFTPTERMELLATLRFFLETCPACGDSVQLEDEQVESCCRWYDVVRTVCLGCNVRLCEFEWT